MGLFGLSGIDRESPQTHGSPTRCSKRCRRPTCRLRPVTLARESLLSATLNADGNIIMVQVQVQAQVQVQVRVEVTRSRWRRR